MRKRPSEEEKPNSDRWLLTYSDMMNNLLVLFIVLYAMSVLDMTKFKVLARELSNAFSNTPMTDSIILQDYEKFVPEIDIPEEIEENDEFDEVYEMLKNKIAENGYENLVDLERGENYINFRFGENVLFYPDSPVIKTDNVQVLKFIGDILGEIDPLIQTIEIGGHTASTGEYTTSFFSWELSSDRAISVLKYLVRTCDLPESKMSVSGYSRYHPIASNETEESRQLNRRVEIKITRVTSSSKTSTPPS